MLRTGLPLIKNVIKPSAKSVWIPLGLTAAASAADPGIHKKILGSGQNNSPSTALIISNNDIEGLIKIVKSLEDSNLLLKGLTETVQNEINEQKGGFLSMLWGTLGGSLLGNLLTGGGVNKKGKGIIRAGEEVTKSTRQGQGIVRAGYGHCFSKNKNNTVDF